MSRPPILGIVAALGVGLLAGLLFFRSGAPPELTAEALDDARRLWQERGASSYLMELQMSGALNDLRRVEVRDGRVASMTIDGDPVPETAWDYWSVEGLFQALETELANAQDPPPGLGVTDPSQVVLRGRFDSELGYPTEFLRHVMGRQQGTEWQVITFESTD